jgi:hypothetical protein
MQPGLWESSSDQLCPLLLVKLDVTVTGPKVACTIVVIELFQTCLSRLRIGCIAQSDRKVHTSLYLTQYGISCQCNVRLVLDPVSSATRVHVSLTIHFSQG